MNNNHKSNINKQTNEQIIKRCVTCEYKIWCLLLDLCFKRWTRAEWKIVSDFRFYIPAFECLKMCSIVVVFLSARHRGGKSSRRIELNRVRHSHTQAESYSETYKKTHVHTCVTEYWVSWDVVCVCECGIVDFSRGKSLNHALSLIFFSSFFNATDAMLKSTNAFGSCAQRNTS